MPRNFASNLKVVNGRLEPKHRPQRLTGEGERSRIVRFGNVRSLNMQPAKPEDKRPQGIRPAPEPFVHSPASRSIFRFLERTAKA